jgi:hypothetical protein
VAAMQHKPTTCQHIVLPKKKNAAIIQLNGDGIAKSTNITTIIAHKKQIKSEASSDLPSDVSRGSPPTKIFLQNQIQPKQN